MNQKQKHTPYQKQPSYPGISWRWRWGCTALLVVGACSPPATEPQGEVAVGDVRLVEPPEVASLPGLVVAPPCRSGDPGEFSEECGPVGPGEDLPLALGVDDYIELGSLAEVADHAAANPVAVGIVPGDLPLSSGLEPFDPQGMANCIERSMYDLGVVGYSYAIVRSGQLEKADGLGYARAPWEDESPAVGMTQNKRMTVASISKTVTAVGVMLLVEQGLLSLDQAFYPFVSDDYPDDGPGVNTVTVRQLLSHTSGLTKKGCGSIAESLSSPASGNAYQYANLNYCLLRKVIEQVTGEDYVTFIQDQILEPMDVTGMSCEPDSSMPTLYYNMTGGQGGKLWGGYTETCGAYGWSASAIDLAKFLAHFRYNTVLSAETQAQMLSDCPTSGYCLGWQVLTGDQGTYYAHGGDWINGSSRGFTGVIMHFNFNIDAVLLVNTRGTFNKTIVLRDAYDKAFKGGCAPPPELPGPPSCPDTGCGTKVNGLCATVGTYPDGTLTPVSGEAYVPQNHPDGAAAFNQYCEDAPEIENYVPNAPNVEMVCAKSGGFNVCKSCGNGGLRPGCECDPANPDSCAAGLTCFESTGYAGNQSFSKGRCWDAADGPPSWECQGDCHAVYGGSGYCHHGALPWEGAGTPICASNFCDADGVICAQSGLFCNTDSDQCEVECNGAIHNPNQGLFSCQGRGYPAQYGCHQASQRCFIGGVSHP